MSGPQTVDKVVFDRYLKFSTFITLEKQSHKFML